MRKLQSYVAKLNDATAAAQVLDLTDKYIRMRTELGDAFLLPKEHSYVEPALKEFKDDPRAWLDFVREIRDMFPVNGKEFGADIQDLYRRVELRVVQAERRDRLDRAVKAAIRAGAIENSPVEKKQYEQRCVAQWNLRKQEVRKTLLGENGRANRAEYSQGLANMWAEIDNEIASGAVF